jgi:hypothetical protein
MDHLSVEPQIVAGDITVNVFSALPAPSAHTVAAIRSYRSRGPTWQERGVLVILGDVFSRL